MDNEKKYCIINLKAYEEVFNTNLTGFIQEVDACSAKAQEIGVELILCVNSYDIKEAVMNSSSVQIYAQHIDPVGFGSHTGHFPTICVLRLGALGTLISHSEHYLSVEEVMSRVQSAQELYLETCVCVRDNQRLKELKKYNISGLVALEPPELIGGDISVTTANPQIITKAVQITQNSQMKLLVGAGIKTGDDVKMALELGADGILVASGVIKADNIKEAVLDLLKGFEK